MSKVLSYRSDIDTLRAVAVLSVVIFHFEKSWLPGGFLGVDVFFVISGFLITLIIHREMSSGTFSFKNFYVRRIKRILPAFFVVVAVSLAIGALLFTKDDFFILWKSALASMGFVANLYYSRGQGYFDPSQEEKPLLHIWSLSVEEQYYFVFPVLLLLVVKKSWRTQFSFLLLLIILSISASFMTFLVDKYYLPHLRAFEMLFGSFTAVWMQYQQQRGRYVGERYAAFASVICAAVLFACFLFYTQDTSHFPGPAAVIPCLAAAGLIYFNFFDHAAKKLFQWKGTVAVGLISYSLYLWHWPVLAFARYITGQLVLPGVLWLPLAALMAALATASYFFVEKPFKNWRGSFLTSSVFIYVLPTIAIAAASFFLLRMPFMNQYNEKGLARSYTSCHNNTDKQCNWGDLSRPPRILILGDSHADQYKTFFDYLGKKEKWSATMVSSDSCAYVDGYDAKIFHKNATCRAVYQYAQAHLADYPIVMLVMRWGNQIPTPNERLSFGYDKGFFNKFDAMLAKLSAQKQAVYVFADNPKIQYPALRAYLLEQRFPSFRQPLHAADAVTAEGNRRIAGLAAKYRNVRIVDAASLIPDGFRIDGLPVYSDLDHISPYGAEALAKKFAAKHSLLAD